MDSNTTKSFWQRPEGTTGKIVVGAILIGLGLAFFHFLPLLITLAENTIYLGVLIGVIAAIFYTVTAERPRTLLFYALQAFSRYVTSYFVNIDPVGILKDFIKNMERKRVDVQNAIKEMRQVRAKTKQQIDLKQKERDDAVGLANAASQRLSAPNLSEIERNGLQIKLQQYAEKVARRDKAINTLNTYIATADQGVQALTRIDNIIEYHISNSTDEMEELKNNNDIALQMIAASKAANAALGDSDKLDVKNMAVDVIRDRVATATAEVEHLLETTRSVQGDMDLEKLAMTTEGLQKIQQINARIDQAEQNAIPRQAKARVLSSGTGFDSAPSPASANQWADILKKQ